MPYVTSGLLLYFNAKDKANPSTTWEDLSGNNHNAALSGFAGTTASGWTGTGLSYDGVDDVAKITTYIPMSTDSDFTLEIYFQTSVPTTQQRIIAFGSGTRFYFQVSSSGISVGIGGNTLSLSASYLPGTNTKTHYIFTRTGTNYALWKDGIKVTNGTFALQSSIVLGAGYILGASYEGDGYLGLKGIMYLNRWYNRALADAEVTQNYNDATSTAINISINDVCATASTGAIAGTVSAVRNVNITSAVGTESIVGIVPQVSGNTLITAAKATASVQAVPPTATALVGGITITAVKGTANVQAIAPGLKTNITVSDVVATASSSAANPVITATRSISINSVIATSTLTANIPVIIVGFGTQITAVKAAATALANAAAINLMRMVLTEVIGIYSNIYNQNMIYTSNFSQNMIYASNFNMDMRLVNTASITGR